MEHPDDECCGNGKRHTKQDDEEALARLEELQKSIEAKIALRQGNLNPDRPVLRFILESRVLKKLESGKN